MENKELAVAAKVKFQDEQNRDKVKQAQHDRDVAVAKLADDKARAQVLGHNHCSLCCQLVLSYSCEK